MKKKERRGGRDANKEERDMICINTITSITSIVIIAEREGLALLFRLRESIHILRIQTKTAAIQAKYVPISSMRIAAVMIDARSKNLM